jgi:Raf kinase inhibitor-like YbhB/YbcL family protein
MEENLLTLRSPAFDDGGIIPDIYTCKGANISPPLVISNVPAEAVSLALIMHDPDAPGKDFLHWSMWGISPIITEIDEDIPPSDSVEGTNDFNDIGYGGPCPPSGTHRYVFDLYALGASVNLPLGASRQSIEKAIEAQQLARTTLIGTVSTQ